MRDNGMGRQIGNPSHFGNASLYQQPPYTEDELRRLLERCHTVPTREYYRRLLDREAENRALKEICRIQVEVLNQVRKSDEVRDGSETGMAVKLLNADTKIELPPAPARENNVVVLPPPVATTSPPPDQTPQIVRTSTGGFRSRSLRGGVTRTGSKSTVVTSLPRMSPPPENERIDATANSRPLSMILSLCLRVTIAVSFGSLTLMALGLFSGDKNIDDTGVAIIMVGTIMLLLSNVLLAGFCVRAGIWLTFLWSVITMFACLLMVMIPYLVFVVIPLYWLPHLFFAAASYILVKRRGVKLPTRRRQSSNFGGSKLRKLTSNLIQWILWLLRKVVTAIRRRFYRYHISAPGGEVRS